MKERLLNTSIGFIPIRSNTIRKNHSKARRKRRFSNPLRLHVVVDNIFLAKVQFLVILRVSKTNQNALTKITVKNVQPIPMPSEQVPPDLRFCFNVAYSCHFQNGVYGN